MRPFLAAIVHAASIFGSKIHHEEMPMFPLTPSAVGKLLLCLDQLLDLAAVLGRDSPHLERRTRLLV
jgi:hypothetical protein